LQKSSADSSSVQSSEYETQQRRVFLTQFSRQEEVFMTLYPSSLAQDKIRKAENEEMATLFRKMTKLKKEQQLNQTM